VKLVIDSSIWISALKFGGVPRDAAMRAAAADDIVLCRHIEAEIQRVMGEKFGWRRADVNEALAEYWNKAQWVATTGSISGVCRDPADDAILECAVVANAVLIVSGDSDLLELKQYAGVRILTARQYLEHADAASV
jgi:putative PIN family toxin of toxin-antitoxin system